MSVYKARQESVIRTRNMLASLKTSRHLGCGSHGDHATVRDRDGVLRQGRVDRGDRQHPAGINQEVDGFRRHFAGAVGPVSGGSNLRTKCAPKWGLWTLVC